MSTEVLPDIALIGLGNMGSPMAARLIGAGYRVTGFDLDPAARDRLTANGGTGVATAVEAARAAGLRGVLVRTPQDVADALHEAGAI